MARTSMKLVTIVAEAVLKERLTAVILGAGASGFTIVEASGQGSRGLRSTTVVDGQNIRIEAILQDQAAESLLETLEREYFPHYAVIAWVGEVSVIRSEKFGLQSTSSVPRAHRSRR